MPKSHLSFLGEGPIRSYSCLLIPGRVAGPSSPRNFKWQLGPRKRMTIVQFDYSLILSFSGPTRTSLHHLGICLSCLGWSLVYSNQWKQRDVLFAKDSEGRYLAAFTAFMHAYISRNRFLAVLDGTRELNPIPDESQAVSYSSSGWEEDDLSKIGWPDESFLIWTTFAEAGREVYCITFYARGSHFYARALGSYTARVLYAVQGSVRYSESFRITVIVLTNDARKSRGAEGERRVTTQN